jgi:hypothetical protein
MHLYSGRSRLFLENLPLSLSVCPYATLTYVDIGIVKYISVLQVQVESTERKKEKLEIRNGCLGNIGC